MSRKVCVSSAEFSITHCSRRNSGQAKSITYAPEPAKIALLLFKLSQASEALAHAALLCGRLRRLWRAVAGRTALHGQGGDARHRTGQRASATLARPVPAALDRGLEGPAYGGRQHRPVRPLRWKRQDHRPHLYASLKPSVGQLYTGKDETHGVERDNARQRHWLARFRR